MAEVGLRRASASRSRASALSVADEVDAADEAYDDGHGALVLVRMKSTPTVGGGGGYCAAASTELTTATEKGTGGGDGHRALAEMRVVTAARSGRSVWA
jgi:hypothetical protein